MECNKNSTIHSVQQMANCTVSHGEPMSDAYKKTFLTRVIERMIQKGAGKTGLLQSLLKEVKNCKSVETHSNWFLKRIYAPLLSDLHRIDSSIQPDDLTIKNQRNIYYGSKYDYYSVNTMGRVSLQTALTYASNLIVLITTRKIDEDRLATISLHKNTKDCIFVYVSRANKKLPAIRDMLSKRGGTQFVDMSIKYDWEEAPQATTYKRRKGLPCLSNANVRLSGNYDMSPLWKDSDGHKRVIEPKFIVRIDKSDASCFEQFDTDESRIIVNLYGDVAGAYRTSMQEEKYRKLGVPSVIDFLASEFKKEFTYNKAIRRSLSNSFNLLNDVEKYKYGELALINVLLLFPELSKPLNLYTKLSERENGLIKLFYILKANSRIILSGKLNEVSQIIDDIKPSPALLNAADVICKNTYLEVIDTRNAIRVLHQKDTNKAKSLFDFLSKTFN
jgi:hypothetical protein